jgi:S-formylglutathione hydrolase FrmB
VASNGLGILPKRTPSPVPTAPATPAISAAPGSKPWLAWKPTGAGKVTSIAMPAPWTGAGAATIDLSIYTPPGYDPEGARPYPVVYEAPSSFDLWNSSTDSVAELDAMIDLGDMPAAIVVFASEASPPISPSECQDSYDGRQSFETYFATTVVGYVDQHYNTIADPRARAIMGMSEGGYCAAMLASRHPDIFTTSISFSGYYTAGAAGIPSSGLFGPQANLDAHSPALVVPQLTQATRSSMYFIVVADPTQYFYGSEATAFDKILAANGVRYLAVSDSDGHGWDEVVHQIATAMEAWSAQLVLSGIW